jgi:L-2-hydroxyglutarate oxidase LhgO
MARAGHECVIIERGALIGSEISSRNSEVIHAGLYYASGSLKARACVAGKAQLYDYLQSRGLPHARLGKLVVATNDAEVSKLSTIQAQAQANGVNDTYLISAQEAQTLEPALACSGALVSPSTGIIDTHPYMLSLLGEAEDCGAALALNTRVERVIVGGGGFEIHTDGADGAFAVNARTLINCAGLGAVELARNIDGLDPAHVPEFHMVKGSYFSLSSPAPFKRLIYPVPIAHGLGVHLTLDIAGQARFGPDAEVVEEVDYEVGLEQRSAFEASVRRYWPGLPDGALQPGYAGIRPKVTLDPIADFQIDGPEVHGVEGLANYFAIESPGLTSSLYLGDMAVDQVG